MDVAVGLVRAYLQVNGYFTVTEFPVVESVGTGGYRSATDIDVLACRFPRVAGGGVGSSDREVVADPALHIRGDAVDMIVGEVKESRAAFNPAGLDRHVLAATLARFGCCPLQHAHELVQGLMADGAATTPAGHHVRLVAFGATTSRAARYASLSLPHIQSFLEAYVRQHWRALKAASSKDPVLGWLILREKLRLTGQTDPER